jgi:hypothetical protein
MHPLLRNGITLLVAISFFMPAASRTFPRWSRDRQVNVEWTVFAGYATMHLPGTPFALCPLKFALWPSELVDSIG